MRSGVGRVERLLRPHWSPTVWSLPLPPPCLTLPPYVVFRPLPRPLLAPTEAVDMARGARGARARARGVAFFGDASSVDDHDNDAVDVDVDVDVDVVVVVVNVVDDVDACIGGLLRIIVACMARDAPATSSLPLPPLLSSLSVSLSRNSRE